MIMYTLYIQNNIGRGEEKGETETHHTLLGMQNDAKFLVNNCVMGNIFAS